MELIAQLGSGLELPTAARALRLGSRNNPDLWQWVPIIAGLFVGPASAISWPRGLQIATSWIIHLGQGVDYNGDLSGRRQLINRRLVAQTFNSPIGVTGMTPEKWNQVDEIFKLARLLPEDEQASFAIKACGIDGELLLEVNSLLAHSKQAGQGFLESGYLSSTDAHQGHPTAEKPILGDPESPRPAHEKETDPVQVVNSDVPNDLVEGYTILKELHRGGQGIVFQAVQQSTRRKVAIKVILQGPFASQSARRRFEREIHVIAQLKHPNIVEVFHSGVTKDHRQFCVMDYVRGVPLDRFVHDKGLTLESAIELFQKICDAVQYAHRHGVIHRDLKPSNILVDSEGNPKVLDFGLAKQLLDTDPSLVSVTGQVIGTLPYMSPEQTKGNPDEIDPRTDVYSLGVIFYEVLTGQFPYPVVGQVGEVLNHIVNTPPKPPSRVWREECGIRRRGKRRGRSINCPVDSEIETIVLRAIAKERDRRYQSAADLRNDLSRYLSGEALEAKRDSRLYLLHKAFNRHRTYVVVILVFALMIMTFVAYWHRKRIQNEAGEYYKTGLFHFDRGEFQDADNYFQLAEETWPNLEDFYPNYASLMNNMWQVTKSPVYRDRMRRYIRLAESEETPTSDLLNLKGVDLREQGDYRGAIDAHLEGTQLNPSNFANWVSLANCYATIAEYKNAENALLEASRIEGTSDKQVLWHNLLVVQLQLRSDSLSETMGEIPSFHNIDASLSLAKALALSLSKDDSARGDALRIALTACENLSGTRRADISGRAQRLLAIISLRNNDWNRARGAAEEAFHEEKSDCRAYSGMVLAVALWHSDQKSRCREVYQKAIDAWTGKIQSQSPSVTIVNGYLWVDSAQDFEDLKLEADVLFSRELGQQIP